MDIKPLAIILLILVGWLWAIRAGIRIHKAALSDRVHDRRVAIGNTVVSALPLILAAFLAWRT